MRLGPSGRATLRLLACCPGMPTDVVASLLRMRHTRSAAQLLLRLRTAGLVRFDVRRVSPLLGAVRMRAWTLTRTGHGLLEEDTRRPWGPDEVNDRFLVGLSASSSFTASPRGSSMPIAAYRLLAHVVRDIDGPVRVASWECPWIRCLADVRTGRNRYARLPAAAALVQGGPDGEHAHGVLLLPDLGTLPVAGYRSMLRQLIELRITRDVCQTDEPILVVGVAVALRQHYRIQAWQSLLEQLARQAGYPPLRARVIGWQPALPSAGHQAPRPAAQPDQLLALVARHPLLERLQLATLLDTSTARVGRLLQQLTEQGWLRRFQPAGDSLDPPRRHAQRPPHPWLVELTPAGRREAARRLLLPSSVATRHHGLLGTKHDGRFSRHRAHTLGANAVFVAFVIASRRASARARDEALEEWRSAAACTRGRFRPDGYGCYRRGSSRFGFFLEFDRGTEKPREYATKLDTYYRYRDSGAAARDFVQFPTLLVVTTSQLAEDRLARQVYLAAQRHSGTPLSVLLTTTARQQADEHGVLGSIWRGPGPTPVHSRARVAWLPAHMKSSFAAGTPNA